MTLPFLFSLLPVLLLSVLCMLYFFLLQRTSSLESMDFKTVHCSLCGAVLRRNVHVKRAKCTRCGANIRMD